MRVLAIFIALAFGILGVYALIANTEDEGDRTPPAPPSTSRSGERCAVLFGEHENLEFLLRPVHLEPRRGRLQADIWNRALKEGGPYAYALLLVANHTSQTRTLPAAALKALTVEREEGEGQVVVADDLETASAHLQVRWRALGVKGRTEIPGGGVRRYLLGFPARTELSAYDAVKVEAALGTTWRRREADVVDLIAFESEPRGRWAPRLRPSESPEMLSDSSSRDEPRRPR